MNDYSPEVWELLECLESLEPEIVSGNLNPLYIQQRIPEQLRPWIAVCKRDGLADHSFGRLTDVGRVALLEHHRKPEAKTTTKEQSNSEDKPGHKPVNPYKKKDVNARMLETMTKNPDCRGWTCSRWAKHLKCSKPSVVGTETWKQLAMIRDKSKAERAMENNRRFRATGSDQRRADDLD